MELQTNAIYCGDNLEILRDFPEKCVDLIYADPPFFSNKHYEIIWHDGAEIRAFEDRWKGGINQYIAWMRPRLAQCHRVLKDTGSMYLHCDWHANAYLRIIMDKIFGESNFQNEIVWHYGLGAFSRKQGYASKHDTLLFYSKATDFVFNLTRGEPTKQMLAKYCHTDEQGRYMMGYGKKYYLKGGKPLDDVWDIPSIAATGGERIGYPTQKPEALLKRIIEASSNKGDIVLDPFCGCGTTIAVAHQLGRQWVGVDVSPTACRMMSERLNKLGVVATLVNVITIEELKAMEPFAFQDWVIHKIHGTPSNRKTDDKGIDGWTFTLHQPIQVKQVGNVGRNTIDNFETAIRRAGYNTGFIYAFGFGRGAYEEVARAKLDDGLQIELVKIETTI